MAKRKNADGTSIRAANRVVLDAEGKPTRDYSAGLTGRYEALTPAGSVAGFIDFDLSEVRHDGFRACAFEGMFSKLDHARNGVVNGGDIRDMQSALSETYELIQGGDWTHRKAGGIQNEALVVQAFARVTKAAVERVQAWWNGLSQEDKVVQAKRPGIPETVRVIQGEIAAAKLAEAPVAADMPRFD